MMQPTSSRAPLSHAASRAAAAVLSFVALSAPARAQQQTPTPLAPAETLATRKPELPRTVVAANLAGALVGVTSLEAERVITPDFGIGAGATHWSLLSDQLFTYTSADARLRFYTSGAAPTGVSLAVVAGGARVSSRAAGRTFNALGAGVEVSYSELVGRERRLYLAVGAGAKRLYPLGDVRTALRGFNVAYPTARAAIGWGF